MTSLLTPIQRYAVGSLLALALRQAQIHQTRPLGSSIEEGLGLDTSSGGSDPDDPDLWTHESRGLLRPVFSFLDIDPKTWSAIEETAALSITDHHVEALLTIFFEEESNQSPSQENLDQKLALTKSIDALVMTFEQHSGSNEESMEKQREYEYQCRERNSPNKTTSEKESTTSEISNLERAKSSAKKNLLDSLRNDKSMLWNNSENYQCKMAFFYELLSACIADPPKKDKKSHLRSGYDARHRVALRLLGTWFNISWIKVEAMEVMVACTAMAIAKEVAEKSGSEKETEGKWSKWKRGGIIGAAALTGGTLLAITGGLAAPAIAAGFGALAPTLGAIVPVIGASGFAAAASAAGTVAGSVAVAASFGAAGAGLSGRKMARRTGIVKEFEFKPIGENHNQGHLAVGILVSGFVFNDDDFLRPWQHVEINLERYAIHWESKNLIAMSNAIQDWITSSLTMGLMKQGAMMTVLSGLVTALAWPATLLAATNFIDSHWAVAIDRSNQAGKLLAEALIKGLQGNRPVTLFGFSLGARVIFKCLQHLAESEGNEGLIERVVLLGAPIPLTSEPWESSRKEYTLSSSFHLNSPLVARLGDEYESLIQNITARRDYITYREVKTMFMDIEIRKSRSNVANPLSINVVETKRVQKQGKVKLNIVPCQICSGKHGALNCYNRLNIIKYPPTHNRILSPNGPTGKMSVNAAYKGSGSIWYPETGTIDEPTVNLVAMQEEHHFWYSDSGATNHVKKSSAICGV